MSDFEKSQRLIRTSTLTLVELLDEKESAPLYVINSSDLNRSQPRGDIYITVSNGGRDQIVKIPNTWIPIDLTAYAPRTIILGNPDFRQALQRRRITAIGNKTASDILMSVEAQEEQSLLNIRENFADPDAQNAAIDRAGLDNEAARRNAMRSLAAGSGMIEGVQPSVVGLVEREDISDRDLLTGLRNLSLNEKDLHYIMSRVNHGDKPRVVEHIRAQLQATNES